MKSPQIILYACAFLFATCGAPENKTESVPVNAGLDTASSNVVVEDTCCGAKYQIFGETAELWQNTWLLLHPNQDVENPVHRTFSETSIGQLEERITNNFPENDLTGFRLYYGLENVGDSIPILLMTVISECNDLLLSRKACVLRSTTDNDTTNPLITRDLASVYAANWRELVANVEVARSQVQAYNYSNSEILDVLTDSANTANEINIRFGIRSTSPSEVDFEYQVQDSLKYGSIIYCNVLYGSDINPSIAESFDFARPCPKLCGLKNALNDTAIHY